MPAACPDAFPRVKDQNQNCQRDQRKHHAVKRQFKNCSVGSKISWRAAQEFSEEQPESKQKALDRNAAARH